MLTGTKHAFHSYPSLLQLRTVLSAAESESPAQPPVVDANEKLALQLIERMQVSYKKQLLFLHQDIPTPLGMPVHVQVEGVHA